jgi:polygalacturonase
MDRRRLLSFAAPAAAAMPAWAAAAAPVPASPKGLRLFEPAAYGAKADGTTLDTAAVSAAIDACSAAGGGVVYVAPGTYLCGCVVLKSNVTLYLEAGATILGSTSVADYTQHEGPPVRGDANRKHLIFARDAVNVGLAGPGRIDGQGPSFWKFIGRKTPPEHSWRDVATYDYEPLDRPSPLLEFVNCKHLRIEDVRIENASGWTLRPINCENVVIRGIAIKNPVHGPNTDGIDPTGCRNVFIADCVIDTGDDAICLKSENPYGRTVEPSRNITITNCVLTCCCNGLKFGTATRGVFENVTFSNSVIYNDAAAEYRARVIAGIAIEMVDGGRLEGVVISNIRMQNVRTPIFVRRGNRGSGQAVPTPGVLRGVMIDNVHATGAIVTSSITGIPGFDVEDVTVSNIRIESEENGPAEWTARPIPEQEKSYPEARMFGRLPAYGIYCRHVNGLRLRNVVLSAAKDEGRPALLLDDVKDADIDALRAAPVATDLPVIKLTASRDVSIRNSVAAAGTRTFAAITGSSSGISLLANDLTRARKGVDVGEGVDAKAVVQSGNAG